jgi:hypothetical protein
MKNMKKFTIPTLIFITVCGLYWYLDASENFIVKDISKKEDFTLLSNRFNPVPLNVDLKLDGHIDSKFRVVIVGIPSNLVIFDQMFYPGNINYHYKVDYYSGSGVRITYIPKAVRNGELKIYTKINPNF